MSTELNFGIRYCIKYLPDRGIIGLIERGTCNIVAFIKQHHRNKCTGREHTKESLIQITKVKF